MLSCARGSFACAGADRWIAVRVCCEGDASVMWVFSVGAEIFVVTRWCRV